MVAFEVKGDKAAAFRCMNALQIFKISNNLGDAKSLVTHPATTTHQRLPEDVRAELGIFDRSVAALHRARARGRLGGGSRPGAQGCASDRRFGQFGFKAALYPRRLRYDEC